VYTLFDTPIWYESVRDRVQAMLEGKERIKIAKQRRQALENELREVSIRVNLFEKILIPRSVENIKRIKIFLSDQQLAAIAQAKVAKKKISAEEGA
jgi:V/A-type H+/Na+-transporting ATPase subunit D